MLVGEVLECTRGYDLAKVVDQGVLTWEGFIHDFPEEYKNEWIHSLYADDDSIVFDVNVYGYHEQIE